MVFSLRSFVRRAVPVVAMALSPVVASAQGFSFFGSFGSGPNPGTIAGTLTLAGFTTGASGAFSASSLAITQYPSGIALSPEGNVATSWSLQTANSFTTLNGAIAGWQFIAGTGAQYDGSSYLLCLNSGASVPLPPNRECGTNLNFIGFGGSSDFAYNFDGAQGLAFSPLQTTVPEPASLALFATGVGGMAMASIRRRRRRAAV